MPTIVDYPKKKGDRHRDCACHLNYELLPSLIVLFKLVSLGLGENDFPLGRCLGGFNLYPQLLDLYGISQCSLGRSELGCCSNHHWLCLDNRFRHSGQAPFLFFLKAPEELAVCAAGCLARISRWNHEIGKSGAGPPPRRCRCIFKIVL